MTHEDILAGLRDIHLPAGYAASIAPGIVWWPIIATTIGLLVVWLAMQRRRSAWKKQVHRELAYIQRAINDGGASAPAWQAMSRLLRRIALLSLPNQEVASLTGDRWLASLDELFATKQFTEGAGRGLVQYPYLAATHADVQQLHEVISLVRQRLDRVSVA